MTTALITTATDLALPPGFIAPTPPVTVAPAPVALTPIPVAPDRLLAVRQHDGNPITHLSKSSFETFSACPERFRRRYVLGQTCPSAPRIVLGNMVDAALTWLAQQRIADRHPEQGDLRAYYLKQAIPAALARERLGVAWTDGQRLEDLRILGWKAILAYQRELAPLIGRAQSAQRKMQFKLTPTAAWVVQGVLDLEVITREAVAVSPEDGQLLRYEASAEPVAVAVEGRWVQTEDNRKPRGRDYLKARGLEYHVEERSVEEIVDYKVVTKAPAQVDADDDMQITTYLAGREIEGRPAERFRLAAMCKPTKTLGFRCKTVASYRGARQRRGALARYATVARSINAFWREFGPDQPWQYADPKGNWRCAPKFCDHWPACAGGAGY